MKDERESRIGVSSRRKVGWALGPMAFDRLLAAFSSDREQAGETYEQLRNTLVTFFDWRGCADPEELADETFNRLARRLEEGEEIRNAQIYCLGVARLLVLEVKPKQNRRAPDLDALLGIAAPVSDKEALVERERKFDCLERCLERLSAENRALLISYYQGERAAKIDHRLELAKSLGITLNSLRVRLHRLKARLEICVRDCFNAKP